MTNQGPSGYMAAVVLAGVRGRGSASSSGRRRRSAGSGSRTALDLFEAAGGRIVCLRRSDAVSSRYQAVLFPQQIKRIRVVQDFDLVRFGNASDAIYAADDKGRRWVKKVLMGSNELLAEAAGWLFSGALDVPTADAAIQPKGAENYWLSGLVEPVTHWDPSRVPFLSNPEGLGAMIALDAIIGNWDRHDGNILVQPTSHGHARVVSIDVAGSWIGTAVDLVSHAGQTPDVDRVAPGIPVDLISESALDVAKEATKLTEATVRRFIREACQLARCSDENVIRDAMVIRCRDAESLVTDYLQKLEKRP